MRIETEGRRAGKTHRLVWLLKEDPKAVLIVFSQQEVDRIIREYDSGGHFGLRNRVISCQSIERLKGIDATVRHVDDLDLVLSQFVGGRVGEAWYTPDELERGSNDSDSNR